MWRIAVLGKSRDVFSDYARECLSLRQVILEFEIVPGNLPADHYDALLVLSGTDLSDMMPSCRILIIPDDVAVKDTSAVSVVTYGLSPKNTITLSSIENNKYTVAIQRDIVSLKGTIIIRQELILDCDLTDYETMALASLMAISGMLEL